MARTDAVEISRANPTCFLFLVDQSGSMAEPWGAGSGKSKAQGVADAVNQLLETLVSSCSTGEVVLDRYEIGMIGYGGEVGLGFPIDALGGSVLQPVSLIDLHPLRIEQRTTRVEDGAGGWLDEPEDFRVWLEPKAYGKTLMCMALRAAGEVLGGFIAAHPGCFPPMVINITDGLATDGAFEPEAFALWRLKSQGGNVLLFNVNISARSESPILFPSDELNLPDEYARRLFRVSSPLPPGMLHLARIQEEAIEEGARGFAFNADLAALVSFLDIGTKVYTSAR